MTSANTPTSNASAPPTSAQIRQAFIDFFVQKHGHTFVPSSPVVPHDDPTLLFTNAGMNQFKPIFLGQEKRAYTRAVNTQKCIRAGGKHNDLDDVGRSRRHHTFFEMLGNWSFGDYFKQGAIEMSWELLTKVWGMDPRRLHVTCYEGDEKNGIPRDTEAAEIWKKVANWEQYGLKSEDHIHFFGAKDNFWEMGETGPCGPCTEINVDRRPQAEIDAERAAGKKAPVNGDDPRVMEIWNNVFIQFNRNPDRTLTVLPAQHVDTGMGLERLIQVLQNVESNYEIDLFHPFWAKLKELSGHTYSGKYPKTNAADPVAEAADETLRKDIAYRVIADHIRCLTFALTDGATISNEGRGYVLRRILRRAVRFGRQQLGLKDPFLYQLVNVVVEAMGDAFPELKKNPGKVAEVIKDEEVSFGRTLDRGIVLFNKAAATGIVHAFTRESKLSAQNGGGHFLAGSFEGRPTGEQLLRSQQDELFIVDESGTLELVTQVNPGTALKSFTAIDYGPSMFRTLGISSTISVSGLHAFKLHDTYGFPIDLTRIMAEERGMTVDIAGYEKLMEEAKDKARAGGKGEASAVTMLPPAAIEQLAQAGLTATLDAPKYVDGKLSATVKGIWNGSELLPSATPGAELAILLDTTNFYAEMGGQVGDTGTLVTANATFEVTSTRSVGALVLHIGKLTSGTLALGDSVTASVSKDRDCTEQNHTSTHLANWALREVLGEGIQQKGSLVDPDKLRFDFSHTKALELAEIEKVETLVNGTISKRLPVYAKEAPQEQALKIHGLRAVFGEKYPPMVRVVSVGVPVEDLLANPSDPKWQGYSIEFCGGTHLANSADAGAFVVTEESSVSKGIRRIVALTGNAAHKAQVVASTLDAAIGTSKVTADADLPKVITQIQQILSAADIPLRAKRRGQAAILDLQARYKAYEKANKAATAGSAVDPVTLAAGLLAEAPAIGGGGKLVIGEIPGATDDQLRSAMDSLRKKAPSLAMMLAASSAEGKVTFLSVVTPDLVAQGLKAGDWVRETAKVAGGGGGGKPDYAQAGGKDPSKIKDALTKAKDFATTTLR